MGGGLYYSEKNGIFQSSPVVSAATELVFRGDYSDETVLHFAVNENNSMQYYFVRTWYPDAEISFFPSIDDCLKAVSEGRAGCTTLNGLRANEILRNSRYSGLSLLQTPHDDDRCFGIRIGNEGLLKLVNRGINVLGSDYAQNLAFRYTNQLYTYSFADLLNDHIVLFTGIVLAVAAVIILFLVPSILGSSALADHVEHDRAEHEDTDHEGSDRDDHARGGDTATIIDETGLDVFGNCTGCGVGKTV